MIQNKCPVTIITQYIIILRRSVMISRSGGAVVQVSQICTPVQACILLSIRAVTTQIRPQQILVTEIIPGSLQKAEGIRYCRYAAEVGERIRCLLTSESGPAIATAVTGSATIRSSALDTVLHTTSTSIQVK